MRRAALVAALCCIGVHRVDAQTTALDRRVSLHVRDVALRDALDRLALQASVRLSYSGDHLPLDRRVSANRDTARLGEVLTDLVRPFAVRPVAVGADHVVLAPIGTAAADSVRAIQVLDRVVVTGSVVAASERPLPVAIDVVSGRASERRDENTLSEILSGSVPGVWMWEQTPTNLLARYGSIRGASSFGLTFPKVYIDGIEVANPLLLTQVASEMIERIEVIRGPQGAALYGSDAISGVVNIVSRHEGTAPDGTHALLRSTIGSSATRYRTGSATIQDHALTIRGGTSLRSRGVTVGGATAGEYIPGAYSREFRVAADTRLIGARRSVIGNARFQAKSASAPANPLLAPYDTDDDPVSDPQTLQTYALGSTFTATPREQWTYSVTAGLDGYRLSNVATERGPVPSVADTALQAASGAATRATLRAAAVANAGTPDRVGATITLAAEQSTLWDRTAGAGPEASTSGSDELVRNVTSSTGLLAQATGSFRDVAFVTAGVRREMIYQLRSPVMGAVLPLLGVSVVKDLEGVSLKGRAAFGKGIRAPRSSMHLAASEPRNLRENLALMPEEQSGVEAGVDVRLGRLLGVHVTRFDQLVSGLVQLVPVPPPPGVSSGSSRSSWYQLQNIGEITNRGWETQASVALGSLQLSGAATLVDSRVRRVAMRYSGELRPGDRMLAVPARTISGTATWTRSRYGMSATVSRASDWINYDRLRIARALVSDSISADDLTGAALRGYWTPYPGTTRLRATVTRDFWRGLSGSVTGENLLGHQRGEPDTITIVPGRTISVGLRARF